MFFFAHLPGEKIEAAVERHLAEIRAVSVLRLALVALGIAFSMLFPPIAPAYFTLKEFKENDWSAETLLGAAGEAEGGYDVLILGAGIGGLTCGALLAPEGCRVAVFERHHLPGGG